MFTCFVVMGFGVKTDYRTGRKLDLDKSYLNLIKPAVEAADKDAVCQRADEIVHAGIIDVPMYERLLKADLVIADVSTMNPNAFYELGVRHALRPHTTIIVAESELEFPFDVGHIEIRHYKHLGEDIGFSEAVKFKGELTAAIRRMMSERKDDSPVYTYLHLTPPISADSAGNPICKSETKPDDRSGDGDTLRVLLDKAESAISRERWSVAKELLTHIREEMQKKSTSNAAPVDPYVLRRLALATYKSDDSENGLSEASSVLLQLSPQRSNDPETLEIWGAIKKRLWESTKNPLVLDEAIAAYERGFLMRNKQYNMREVHFNGVNLAFLLNSRAAISDGEDAIADRVLANRVRKQILLRCEEALLQPDLTPAAQFWALGTMAEAWYGLGNNSKSEEFMNSALKLRPEEWMVKSVREQIAKLDKLTLAAAAQAN